MTPSLGTLRWTLTGPGAGGGGSAAAAIRAPRSLPAAGGRDRTGQGLGQDAVADDVDQVPVEPQRDPAAGQLRADLDPVTGQVGDPVAVDGPVDLDHRAAGQGAGLAGGCAGGGPAGLRRASAAGQVLGVQAGRDGLDQLAADEHMHGELVGPHVGELPGPLSAHLDPLYRGEHAEHAAGRDHGVELDRSGRLRAEQAATPAGRPRAGSGDGCGADPARPGSGRVPGRNRLAGVAMSSAWCGRAWL